MSIPRITEILDLGNDKRTNALITAEVNKILINEGKAYTMSTRIQNLASGANTYFGLVVPADKEIHYKPIDYIADAESIKIEFFEDSDFSSGTELNIVQRNRNISTQAETKAYASPTITSEGDLFYTMYILGKDGGFLIQELGGSVSTDKFVLKKNTKYLVKITNEGTGAVNLVLKSDFYEV